MPTATRRLRYVNERDSDSIAAIVDDPGRNPADRAGHVVCVCVCGDKRLLSGSQQQIVSG